MNVYDIIKRPRITEKSVYLQNEHNAYTFEVHQDANKIEIKKAVESLFKVKVTGVRTQVVPGKSVRRGKSIDRHVRRVEEGDRHRRRRP